MKYYRKKCGLTQEKLAEQLGMSTNYIGGMEAREGFPSVETIEKMAKVFNIKPASLFEEEGCPECINDFSREKYNADLKTRLKELVNADIDKFFDSEA